MARYGSPLSPKARAFANRRAILLPGYLLTAERFGYCLQTYRANQEPNTGKYLPQWVLDRHASYQLYLRPPYTTIYLLYYQYQPTCE